MTALTNKSGKSRLWRNLHLGAFALLPMAAAVTFTPALLQAAERAAIASPHVPSATHAQGYLGVELHDLPEDQVAALHIQGSHAAEVTMVDHDGPAGKAGLQPHDVVLQVDGQAVETADDLRRRIRECAPGRVISLAVMRLGRMMTLTAKLADRGELERSVHPPLPDLPEPSDTQDVLVQRYSDAPPPPRSSSHGQSFIGTVLRTGPYTGVSLDSMSPQLALYFGAPEKSGLLIDGIDPNSPAAAAGLHAGDVVLRVDSNLVSTPSEWTKRLRASNGRAVSLTILREHHEQTLTLQPDLKRHSLLEWPKLF